MHKDQETTRVRAWVEGYVRAWSSNDPAAIGALFTEDAAYHTEPYGQPWRGRDEIVRGWLDRRDELGDTEFHWHPPAVAPDGRRTEFPEWWMQHPRLESLLEASVAWWPPRSSKPV